MARHFTSKCHPVLGTDGIYKAARSRRDVRLSESNRDGGMARFSIGFVETGANINPTQGQDSSLVIPSAALSARQALEAAFAESYAGSTVPDFVRQRALQDMTTISDEVSANIAAAPLLRNSLGPALSEAQGDITSLQTSALRDATTTFKNVAGLYDAIADNIITLSGNARRQGIRSLTALSDGDAYISNLSTALPNATASRQFEADNREVLVLSARVNAILAAVSVVPNVPYQSREDAENARTNLTLSLEILADDIADKGWDNTWRQLNDLRVLVNRDLGGRAGSLPRLVVLNRPRPISSSLLAWQLYGASPDKVIDKAADLVARNKAHHPSFLKANNLEALIDD